MKHDIDVNILQYIVAVIMMVCFAANQLMQIINSDHLFYSTLYIA